MEPYVFTELCRPCWPPKPLQGRSDNAVAARLPLRVRLVAFRKSISVNHR